MRAVVPCGDPVEVARALRDRLGSPALLIVFASWKQPVAALAEALDDAFPGARIVGCTSFGELGDGEITDCTVSALAFDGSVVRAGVGLARDLRGQTLTVARDAVAAAAGELDRDVAHLDPRRHVGLTLFDGSSVLAESFCLGTAASAPQIRFAGGAASDQYESGPPQSRVFVGREVAGEAGVVVVIETDRPFDVVAFEHLEPTDQRAVVTAADPDARVVFELDGKPAAERYRAMVRAIGGGEPSTPSEAASFPFARFIDDKPYIRSVFAIEGNALRMASAIERGQIVRLMRAGDLIGSTERELSRADRAIGGMAAMVAFSCVGRHLESVVRGQERPLAEVYRRFPITGFHSFGEQIGATLVNHTMTGLVIGG
jgi:hypothetical protein